MQFESEMHFNTGIASCAQLLGIVKNALKMPMQACQAHLHTLEYDATMMKSFYTLEQELSFELL